MRKFKCKGVLYQHNRGAATILITMLILSFIMATSGIVARLMVQEIRMGQDIVKSFKAYEGAIGGLENGSKIVKDNISNGLPASNGLQLPVSPPDQSYRVSFVDPAGNLFSRGLKDNLERQIEMSVYDVVAVAAGSNHSLALRSDGAIWAWGDNSSGQLGDGSNNNSSVPIRVGEGVADFKNIKAIAAGGAHSLALKNDGTVWSWGKNINCQLGNNINPCVLDSSSPVKVRKLGGGDLTNIIFISAGFAHSLAIQDVGGVKTVWSWGNNSRGQLGYNTGFVDREYASKVNGEGGIGDLNNIVSVAAGDAHSVAVNNTGNVFAWGLNLMGQLGNNSWGPGTDSVTPVRVQESVGLGIFADISNVKAVSAGLDGHHTLALRSSGQVFAWGDDSQGKLGDGVGVVEPLCTCSPYATPVSVLTNINNIAASSSHSLALNNVGQVWAWGDGGSGRLGQGAPGGSNTPVKVHGLNNIGDLTEITQIAGGGGHSLATRLLGGKVLSWGSDSNEQLGNGAGVINSSFPVKVNGF